MKRRAARKAIQPARFASIKRLGRTGTLWEGRYKNVLVEDNEQALRKRFGEKRTTGARRMRGADWGELRVLRDLQKDVMGT
jgi:hypothetical protein